MQTQGMIGTSKRTVGLLEWVSKTRKEEAKKRRTSDKRWILRDQEKNS